MIKYRPHRGNLSDSMALEKEFESISKMYDYIVSDWGNGKFFSKEDMSITDDLGKDDRIDWKETRYVCVKRMGNDIYDYPQCIGMCSIEL